MKWTTLIHGVLASARTLWRRFNRVALGIKTFPFFKTKEPVAMNTNDGRNHLYDVVNDFDVAMLVTHTANTIHARPMAIAQMDDGIGAYLVTDINSLKIEEIR
jgi:hypothetical protein